MMIECPRCGFEQPKDQFCASCGLDIEHYVAKPKPVLVQLLQNPNLHLTLIGISIVLVVGYIFYSQREVVSKQMGNFLDMPVSSRDAGDPGEQRPASPPPVRAQAPPPPAASATAAATTGELAATRAAPPAEEKSAAPADALTLTANHKLEVTHWEVPREALANLLALAERIGESTAGRAYLFPTGSKIATELAGIGQKMSGARTVATRTGSQLTIETPPTTAEAFQFAMFFQLTKVEGKELNVKFESQLVLPQPETPAEAASETPTVRATTESNLNGAATFTSAGLLLIVMEPTNRSPREEFLARAGEGPWSIFSSQEFRGGLTDWAVAVQIK